MSHISVSLRVARSPHAFCIPKAVWLLGHRYEVVWVEDLLESADAVGESLYRKQQIRLQCPSIGFQRPQSQCEHTFLHELLHCILHELGEQDLRENDKLIDLMSGLLHQALTLAEFDDDDSRTD